MSRQTFSCNDCRYRCSDFRNLDQHIATKHQRPHHIPDLTLMVGDSQMKTVYCRRVEAALGGKLVCGEHIATKSPGRRSPRAGKPGRAYNSVSSWPYAKYTESSIDNVVPQLLSQTKSFITTLVIQSPTSDITNLHAVPEQDHKDLVLQSARNVVSTAEKALADHPSLRKAVILEQLPRKDSIHFYSLTLVYNSTLQKLAAASHHSSQLFVTGHPSLSPTTEAKTTAMFGSPANPRSDGIHFRGAEGARRHTDSVISALKSAGLAGWNTQGHRGAARLQPSGPNSQTGQTGNRFQPLNC